ncbi:MAG: cytosolic protein, partial [Epsilonproteobacteria bacterium]|nr:cytosolic protein [Campylobacterota bacterium]
NLNFTYEWDVELSKTGKNMWGEYLKSGKSYINVRPDGYISH